MAKKRTIRIVYTEDTDYKVFNESGKQIGSWHANDGKWREEYFNPFLEELGIKVVMEYLPYDDRVELDQEDYAEED